MSDQMGDGTITTNRLFLSDAFSRFPFRFYCNEERGEEKL